jgi:hypothetical protein
LTEGSVATTKKGLAQLFFWSMDAKMMAVDVNLSGTVKAGIPHVLFTGGRNVSMT